MEHYLHRIIESDDVDTKESKHDHNKALMNHTQLKIFHEGIKHEMDKEKLEKLKEEYNQSSEIILESTWNLEDDFTEETTEHSDKIVTNLYEDLANLNLEERREESSMEKKEDDPVAAAKCTPISGVWCLIKAVPLGWQET